MIPSACFLLALSIVPHAALGHGSPNIVLILADDQDYELGSLQAMPKLRRLLADQGTTFRNMFVTTPLCCPSRSSIVTGQYVHNNRAKRNAVADGCSSEWFQENMETDSVFKAVHDAGYKTFYAGKYLNQYGYAATGGPQHVPPGIDWWMGHISNVSIHYFYNYSLSVNGTAVEHGDEEQDYLTTVIHNYAMNFFDFVEPGQPFFMMLTPTAPHTPAVSIPPYTHNFTDLNAPRTPAFNHHSTDKHWLMRHAPSTGIPEEGIEALDELFRNRWRSLQSVDDLVEAVVNRVDDLGLLEDTYFLYSADNAFHLGQFGFPWDKRLPYEFDVRVPLIVRGPGVHKGVVRGEPVLNIDLAPTIADFAGASLPRADGQSFMQLLSAQFTQHQFRKEFLIEYWGVAGADTLYGTLIDSTNNSYSCLRTISPSDNGHIYCDFQDSEHFVEYYHLVFDPYQLVNTVDSLSQSTRQRLSDTLQRLKSCKGGTCRID